MQLLAKFGNPYLNFAGSFLLAVALYSPSLSSVFPELGSAVCVLLALIISTAVLLGVFSQRKVDRIIFAAAPNRSPYAPKLFVCVLPLALLEIAIFPSTPLAMAVSGAASHKSFVNEYGIPTVHALILSLCQVVAVQGGNELIAGKESRLKILLATGGAIGLLLIFLSRGALVICLLASTFCFLSSIKRRQGRRVVAVILLAALALYVFGWLGNIRTGDEEYILGVGGANERVFGGLIPAEFFWGYVYLVSPLANLELSVDLYGHVQQFNIFAVTVLDVLPDVISKRVSGINQEWIDYRPLVHPALTVGSTFARPYYFAGPVGAAIVFGWTIIIIYLSLMVSSKNPYAMTILGFANALGFLCVFTNSAVFSSIIGPIGICAALGFVSKLRWNVTKSHVHRKLR